MAGAGLSRRMMRFAGYWAAAVALAVLVGAVLKLALGG